MSLLWDIAESDRKFLKSMHISEEEPMQEQELWVFEADPEFVERERERNAKQQKRFNEVVHVHKRDYRYNDGYSWGFIATIASLFGVALLGLMAFFYYVRPL